MKNMIDIATLKASYAIRAIARIDLVSESSDYIQLLVEEFRETRQPFYRIWYYQREAWPTGYTDAQLKFLKQAFNRIRKNELTCQKILCARRRQGV